MRKDGTEPFEALVLAGGDGRRLGGPKALIDWNGVPLWRHIAEKVATVATKVFVVGLPGPLPSPLPSPSSSPSSLSSPDCASFQFIDDPRRDGPLGGLVLGLHQVSSAKVFVIACDMPFVHSVAILELVSNSQDVDVVVPRTADRVHPLFAVYSRTCLPVMEAFLADRGRRMQSLLANLQVREIVVTNENPVWQNVLININTPAELAAAIDIYRRRVGADSSRCRHE